jgi:hypothetical protein
MSQSERILAHLKAGNSITPLEALHWFGCLRLAARILDLREHGHNVISVPMRLRNKKRVACYRLIKQTRV